MEEQVKAGEEDIVGVAAGIEAAQSENKTRKENLRQVIKLSGGKMLFVGAVIVFMVVYGWNSLAEKAPLTPDMGTQSEVNNAPHVENSPQFNGQVSDNYAKLAAAENEQGAKDAAATGESHIDAILPGSVKKIETGPQEEQKVVMPSLPMPVQMPSLPQNTQADSNVRAHMDALLSTWAPSKHTVITFTPPTKAATPAGAATVPGATSVATVATATQAPVPVRHHKIGDQLPVVLTLGANSDEPGVIAGRVVHGPYKGAMVTGSFAMGREALTLNFNNISLPWASKSIKINTVAIDPDTGSQSIAKEIDRHYMERLVLPFMAKFITGYGEVIAKAGQTTINSVEGGSTTTYPKLSGREQLAAAAGQGAEAVGEILNENASRKITIKIPPNTPVSLMLLEDVDLPVNPQDNGDYND